MPALNAEQEHQIREYIRNEQLIYAIKLYREVTGLGLAEAKAAVEALARGESPQFSSPMVSVEPQFNDPSLEAKVKALLAKRNKIEAIKVYRMATGLSLKDAKDIVENIERSMKQSGSFESASYQPAISDDPFAEETASNRLRLLITVVLLLLVLGGAIAYLLVRGG